MIDYATIKALAKQHGLTVNDLCALAPKNDPFYTGRPSEEVAAQWFADLWHRFGYTTGVHLRRVHYQIVSQKPPVSRPNGEAYQNTQKDWDYLTEAAKWARYLDLVSPGAFVDRRNPEAKIHARWPKPDDYYDDPTPGYEVLDDWDQEAYDLPGLPGLDDLPAEIVELPYYEVSGYEGIQQDYHLECWVEKTTMNDVLEPICTRYSANLVTGAGEMSITSVVDFLKRVEASERPARIIYISDFDPAGLGMPISVARKIEYFQRNEGYQDLDIRLQPVALTADQIVTYELPRVPVKNTDLRKAKFEAAHGEGQVELDALEALHPGELARIVRNVILQWYDPTLDHRAREARRQLERDLYSQHQTTVMDYAPQMADLTHDYNQLVADYASTQEEFSELVAPFQPQLDAYEARLQAIVGQAADLHIEIHNALKVVDIDLNNYALPQTDLSPEEDGLLYDSRRDYLDQLDAYKVQRFGNGKER